MNCYLKVAMQISLKTFAELVNLLQQVGLKVVDANRVKTFYSKALRNIVRFVTVRRYSLCIWMSMVYI